MVGICLYSPKNIENWGSILRVAYNFNVDFVCTINSQYKRQSTDTVNFKYQKPIFHFSCVEDFLKAYPKECGLISVEITPDALSLEQFSHFKNAIYIFGPENGSLPKELISGKTCVKINSNRCLNQAMCAGIVMFHRQLTLNHA